MKFRQVNALFSAVTTWEKIHLWFGEFTPTMPWSRLMQRSVTWLVSTKPLNWEETETDFLCMAMSWLTMFSMSLNRLIFNFFHMHQYMQTLQQIKYLNKKLQSLTHPNGSPTTKKAISSFSASSNIISKTFIRTIRHPSYEAQQCSSFSIELSIGVSWVKSFAAVSNFEHLTC